MRFESDVKKASQPLPPARTGVHLEQLGRGSAPPPTFGSASPFGKRRAGQISGLQWAVIGLGLLAAAALVWFVYKYLMGR
jgi:hypothetical protein